MLAYRRIRPLVFVVQAWNTEGEHFHGIVKSSDLGTTKVEEIKRISGLEPFFLNVCPEQLSYGLPGILSEVVHPVTKKKAVLRSVIMSLNDEHDWSREQIADWIETLDEVPTFKV